MNTLSKEQFAEWNESMSLKYDPDLCHESPNPVIRWLEKKRVSMLLRALDVQPTCRTLEIGCGKGNILSELPGKLVGLDLSQNNLRFARQRVQGELILGNAEDASSLVSGLFDRVYCTEVIEHVQHPEKVLCEMAKCLKSDGTAVVTVPNETLINRLKTAMRRLGVISWLLPADVHPVHNPWHLHIFTRAEIRQLCEKYFDSVTVRTTPILPIHFIITLKKGRPA